jgi:hypothetical protein
MRTGVGEDMDDRGLGELWRNYGRIYSVRTRHLHRKRHAKPSFQRTVMMTQYSGPGRGAQSAFEALHTKEQSSEGSGQVWGE